MKELKKILSIVMFTLLLCTTTYANPEIPDTEDSHNKRKTEGNHNKRKTEGNHNKRKTEENHNHNSGRSSTNRSDNMSSKHRNEVKEHFVQFVRIEPNRLYFVKLLDANIMNNSVKAQFNSDHVEDVRIIGIQSTINDFNHYFAIHLRDRKVWLEFDEIIRDETGMLMSYIWLEKPPLSLPATIKSRLLNAILVDKGLAQKRDEITANRYAEYIVE
jgi:hypothetical protein